MAATVMVGTVMVGTATVTASMTHLDPKSYQIFFCLSNNKSKLEFSFWFYNFMIGNHVLSLSFYNLTRFCLLWAGWETTAS